MQSLLFMAVLRGRFGTLGFLAGINHMMSDQRGLIRRDILGISVEPEREGSHLETIPRLGKSSNTPKKLAVSMANAVYAVDLGGLSGVEEADGNVASSVSS